MADPAIPSPMSFDVAAGAYGRFMGRYSEPLGVLFAEAAGIHDHQRVLDVGCGPGALTAELVARLGPEQVAAVDPSESFVAAARRRFPDVEVQLAAAEALPFDDESFDATLAQLVVHFMADPVAGLAEMARVTRPGGTVAACVWDLVEHGPLGTFRKAAQGLDPDAPDEAELPGGREGHLAELFSAAGLADVEQSTLTVTVRYETFDDWWSPYLLGVGPAGDHVNRLDEPARQRLRDRCAELLPPAPFAVDAVAWCVRAHRAPTP